jgi:hypothetical protein
MRSLGGAVTIGVAPALLSLLLTSERAQGADSSPESFALPVTVELQGCEAVDQAELYKLLVIEFRTLNVLPAVPRERIQIACTKQRANVRLETGSSANDVDLSATSPAIWPRLLALSVSELVTESRARTTAIVTPPAILAPIEPPAQPTQTLRDREGFRVVAGVSLRRAVRPATWLAGPDLGAMLDLNRYFSVALDLRLEFGRTHTELAKVDWLSASSGFALLAGGSMGDWHFAAGPGLCVGYLHLSPQVQVENATGHTVSGIWAGPELVTRVRYDLSARWYALGSVDAGFASTSVTGLVNGEQRAIDTGGAWAALMLGAGVLL